MANKSQVVKKHLSASKEKDKKKLLAKLAIDTTQNPSGCVHVTNGFARGHVPKKYRDQNGKRRK